MVSVDSVFLTIGHIEEMSDVLHWRNVPVDKLEIMYKLSENYQSLCAE